MLTTAEVIDQLHIDLRTLYRMLKAGELPAVRVGRQWRFRETDLDAWLAGLRRSGQAASAGAQGPTALPASPVVAERPAAGATPRILVAEADAPIRELLTATLAFAEYDVRTVPDGPSAVALLREQRFQLLITALRVPGLDGLSIVREARRLSPGLPVAIITGYPSEATAIEAINLGVSGYLIKPFRVAKVLALVTRLLGE